MKRTIKSIFAVLVLLILSLSLFACTNESGGNIGIGKNEDVELAETIALNISSNNISKASTLSNELQNPNAECKKIVMEALCDRINSKANTYLTSFASKNELVDEQVISEFRLYENIVNNIGITDTDNTNIQSYISGFLALEKYSKYESLWVFWEQSLDEWQDANTYWERASASYSESMKTSHLQKSLDSFNSCMFYANKYSNSDYGISSIKGILNEYIKKIEYYFETGKDYQYSQAALDNFSSTQDTYGKEMNKMVSEMKLIPTSVFYKQ